MANYKYGISNDVKIVAPEEVTAGVKEFEFNFGKDMGISL